MNIDDTEVFPKLNGYVPPPAPFTGDVCSSDDECGFVSGQATGACAAFALTGEEEVFGFCTVACEGFCEDKLGKAPTFCVSLDGGLTGSCVSQAGARNEACAAIPGTAPVEVERHIGASSASPSTATVCVPSD